METYGHYEFETLLKDEDNKQCFDCGICFILIKNFQFFFQENLITNAV